MATETYYLAAPWDGTAAGFGQGLLQFLGTVIRFVAMFLWNIVTATFAGVYNFLVGDGKNEFYNTLNADWTRTGLSAAVGIIVGVLLWRVYSRGSGKVKSILYSAACGLGSAWIIWDVYNHFTPDPIPLFPGVATPIELFDYARSGFWPLVAGIAAGALAYAAMKRFDMPTHSKMPGVAGKVDTTVRKGLNPVMKVAVITGTWAILMLITSVVINIQTSGVSLTG